MSYIGHEKHKHRPEELLTREEREKVMARIRSLFFWVGETIPDEVEISGRRVPLRDLVHDFVHKQELSDEEREDIGALTRDLQKREKFFAHLLDLPDITKEEAEEISHRLLGILRAIDELRSLEEGPERDIEKSSLMKKIEDEKRWLKYTKGLRTQI
ncbi:MAG: DUF5788 family protein [Candidatus Thermoplasmatota archaeon]|nr:DUF5788 family protein [Candidatus Thermoplasmatota archaeon]